MEPDVPGWGTGRAGTAVLLRRRLGCVCVGEQCGSSCHSRENTWLPSPPPPPVFQGRRHCFCKLEQPNFSQIPESALCVGTIRHRVELGRDPERPPAGQKYVLTAPQAPTCYRLNITQGGGGRGRKLVYPEGCIRTRDREQGRMRS